MTSARRMIVFESSVASRKEKGGYSATRGNPHPYPYDAALRNANPVNTSVTGPESRLRLFEEVILPHLNAAYNLARWLTKNTDDAQDVVQEAYLRAFRFFDTYRGGEGKSWLLEIVRNTCYTWQRREKRNLTSVAFDEATHTPGASSPDAEEALVQAGNRSTLQNCIEKLPEPFREVVVMRELEEMSYRQIAEVAGLAPGTVMSRLSRARKRLEDCAKGRNQESEQ
jgi:RNA polymerase sigma-70 factor (ECF subfamily)